MPCWASAMSDEVPKSIATRDAGPIDHDAGLKAASAAEGIAGAGKADGDGHGVLLGTGEHSTGPASAIRQAPTRARSSARHHAATNVAAHGRTAAPTVAPPRLR